MSDDLWERPGVVDKEFLERVAQVGFDRPDRHEESLGNLVVGDS